MFGIGQEPLPGEPRQSEQTYRVIPLGHDVCEVCDAVLPLAELHYVGTDASYGSDPIPLYVCGAAHPVAPPPN